jgi:hypothetical protein
MTMEQSLPERMKLGKVDGGGLAEREILFGRVPSRRFRGWRGMRDWSLGGIQVTVRSSIGRKDIYLEQRPERKREVQ